MVFIEQVRQGWFVRIFFLPVQFWIRLTGETYRGKKVHTVATHAIRAVNTNVLNSTNPNYQIFKIEQGFHWISKQFHGHDRDRANNDTFTTDCRYFENYICFAITLNISHKILNRGNFKAIFLNCSTLMLAFRTRIMNSVTFKCKWALRYSTDKENRSHYKHVCDIYI